MILVTGIFVVAASWFLAWGLSSAVGLDLYWVVAGLWGWWAAADSQSHDLRRFERVFPLEPMPLFLAILLLFPVALPWYFRLKDRALSGKLTEPVKPSRAKWVLVGIALVGTVGSLGATWVVSNSGSFKVLRPVLAAVQAVSDDAITVTIHTSGQLTLTVSNSGVPSTEREGKAQTLALAAFEALPRTTTVRAIAVQYQSVSTTVGITTRRSQEEFNWSVGALRDAAEYGF